LAFSIEYSQINISNNISNKRINYNDDGLAALPLTDHQNALVCLSISEFWQDREQKLYKKDVHAPRYQSH